MPQLVPQRKLVLASTSPYRRALLERLGVPFSVRDPGFDEIVIGEPETRVRVNAHGKAAATVPTEPNAVIIGSDQLAAVDGAVLGKPGTIEAAERQLASLAGREHRLLTAVTVIDSATGERADHLDETRLRLRALRREEITDYVEREKPLDCAGAYKIEGLGISLFESVHGDDPTAIIGLPLIAVGKMLRRFGIHVLG